MLSICQPPILFTAVILYNIHVEISLRKLLFEKYLEYQKQAEKKVTEKQFAEYIGLGPVFLNQIMNGRRSAGEKTIEHLAKFFSDLRFYDSIGLPRPDPLLHYTTRHWGEAPREVHQKIADEIAKYTTEKKPDDKK